MKLTVKLFCLLMAMPFVMKAQEKSADDYKNEGNEFVRVQNFKSALASYEEAIKLWGDSLDAATVYNAADCARKIKNNDAALKYYKMAEELEYKGDFCAFFIADIYKATGQEEEQEAALQAGIEKYKTGKPVELMKKSLVTFYLKQGMVPYNEAGKILASAASAKPEEYEGITAKANEKFAEAKVFVDKVLAIDAQNANAKKMMDEIVSRLGK